jgi:acyl-CoA thioesterase-2
MEDTENAGTDDLGELLDLLDLERLDRDLFLGSPGEGEGRLFGGLVAAQSVIAAYRTVNEGALHSLHAYFLRPGRHDVPIRYAVYEIRDGRTFTTRDVVAYQAGEAIFNLSSSFAKSEEGESRQDAMPDAPDPEGLGEWTWSRRDDGDDGDPEMERRARRWRASPVEVRACDPWPQAPPADGIPRRRVWMRIRGTLPEDPAVHAAMLAYASDRGLIATARTSHDWRGRDFGASLDHAIWFHHAPRFDDWVLYTSQSPVAHAARALIFGQMYRRDGARIASVVQEGLLRSRPQPRTQ